MEFTNRLKPEAAAERGRSARRRQRLLWQLTGGTETMKVTRIEGDGRDSYRHGDDDDEAATVLGRNLPVLPNNHGPQTESTRLWRWPVQRVRLGRSHQP